MNTFFELMKIRKRYIMSTVAIFVFTLCMYHSNFRIRHGGDAAGFPMLAVSLAREGNLYLDEYFSKVPEDIGLYLYGKTLPIKELNAFLVKEGHTPVVCKISGYRNLHFVRFAKGHFISTYPVSTGIVSLPFFVHLAFKNTLPEKYQLAITSKLTASILTALTVVVVFYTALLFQTHRTSFILALIFALGTHAWSVSSQDLWQHGPSILFLSVGLYLICYGQKHSHFISYAGIPFGISVCIRISNLVPVIIIAFYIFIYFRTAFVRFMIFLGLFILALETYSLIILGDLTAMGQALHFQQSFSGLPLDVFVTHLLSPNRGIFFYTPMLIFALYALSVNPISNPLLVCLIVAALSIITIFSYWSNWWGGVSYGYRIISDAVPFLFLVIIVEWRRIWSSKLKKVLFSIFLAWSIFVQFTGAFGNDTGWYDKSRFKNNGVMAAWEFNNTQIGYILKKDYLKNRK